MTEGNMSDRGRALGERGSYPRSLHQSPGCFGVAGPSLIMCSWESKLMRTSLVEDSWNAALLQSVRSTGACSKFNSNLHPVKYGQHCIVNTAYTQQPSGIS